MGRRASARVTTSIALVTTLLLLPLSCGGHGASTGPGGAGGEARGSGGMAPGGSGGADIGGIAGSQSGGAAGTMPIGSGGTGIGPADAAARDGGFAADFASRAGVALAASAPSWTCATVLPTVMVADATAARDAIRELVAQVAGVPLADLSVQSQTCGASMPTTCATVFAHDVAKSGGSIYDTVVPFAQELEANATDVEVTLWIPSPDGMGGAVAVVMSGITDGLLVGMVLFESPYSCHSNGARSPPYD